MAVENTRTLVAADAELWVDGVDTRPLASQIMVGPQSVEVSATRLRDKLSKTQPVQLTGNLTLGVFNDGSTAFQTLNSNWLSAAAGSYIAPIIWSKGAGGLTIGSAAGATMISPKSAPVTAASSESLITHSFGGSWHAREVFGALQSSTTASGRHPVDSPMTSDFAVQAINTVGPDIYTDSVAVSAVGKPVEAMAAVKGLAGTIATAPTATFAITDTAWRSGILNAANSKSLTIGHTVDGSVVNLKVPVDRSNYFTNETVATVYEDIERLRWADGFQISVTTSGNNVTFTGNQQGADKDIIFAAGNEIPVGSPFTGTYSGTGHNTKFRIVSATGSGGSRVFTPLSDFYDCDEHDLPAVAVGIEEAGLEQIAIQFQVPTAGTPYDFSIQYSLSYIVNGS